MPGNYLLRPARPEEAGALSSLAFAAKRHWGYPDAWMQAWREALTVSAEQIARDRYLVAEREGRPVGFAAVSYAEGRAELDHCWVEPLSIGRGIGRALLTAAYRQCVADGWTQLLIEADPNSVAFYYKLGARPVGEVESTPTGRRLPLFLMQQSEVMLAEPNLCGHWLGMVDYRATWRTMQRFTDCRTEQTGDELWMLEHPPVFTQGQAGKPEHLLRRDGIALVASDRGGQITYHGPGQLVVYPLLDLSRRKLGVRDLVRRLEQSLIDLLADFDIEAYGRVDAPGVYVGEAKIASLGLRIRHGRSYHGLALNVAMDLAPFSQINPCGYSGMAITQLADFGIEATPYSLAPKLADKINALLAADGSATLSDYALSTQPKPEKNQP